MGCDYYIVKYLQVEYVNDDDDTTTIDIELNKEKGYFSYDNMTDSDSDSDSTDDESYNTKFERKFGKYLKVTYVPKTLFSNNKWKSESIQEKYQDIILNEIKEGLLLKVIKKEVRFLR
jgi:hypothetical protein